MWWWTTISEKFGGVGRGDKGVELFVPKLLKPIVLWLWLKEKPYIPTQNIWNETFHILRAYRIWFTFISGLLCLTWVKKTTYKLYSDKSALDMASP